MWWQYYYFFWMNTWTVHIFEFDCLWMLKLLALERMMGKGEMLSDDLKNHKIDSWSKKKQWIESLQKKKRREKEKQAEKANTPLNQKARVIKRIQGFEHQWIGGPTGIKSWPKRLNQAVPNHVLVAWRCQVKTWDWAVKVEVQSKKKSVLKNPGHL